MIQNNLNAQKGLSLIELMIVLVIVAILAMITLTMYQDYIAKSQVNRVYYEINATRTITDSILSDGRLPTLKPE